MTDIKKIKKIYPSAGGFLYGENTYAVDYNSACFRYLLVGQGIRFDLDPKYMEVGAAHEEWYNRENLDQIDKREEPIKRPYGTVEYSGRVDFILKDGSISETKGSFSKNMLYTVIRRKEVKLSHLAQLVSYMLHAEVHKGRIIVGYYKEKGSLIAPVEHTIFEVELQDPDTLLVNGKPFKYRPSEYAAYLHACVKYLTEETVGPRPFSESPWKNPCRYCQLSNLCDKFDSGSMNEEEFKQTSRAHLLNLSKKEGIL